MVPCLSNSPLCAALPDTWTGARHDIKSLGPLLAPLPSLELIQRKPAGRPDPPMEL